MIDIENEVITPEKGAEMYDIPISTLQASTDRYIGDYPQFKKFLFSYEDLRSFFFWGF